MSPIQTMVLAGGFGTRLKQLYPDRPKALVPVAGKPFLAWQLEWLQQAGLENVHLLLGHQAEAIVDWLATHTPTGMTASSSIESKPLGTGGALVSATETIATDPFIALNGDTLMPELDFAGLLAAHRAREAAATLAITPVSETGRYGTVVFDEEDRLLAFREKEERDEGWINGGVYVLNRAALEGWPQGKQLSIEKDVFPSLAEQGHTYIFRSNSPVLDMGTGEGLDTLNRYLGSKG